MMRFIFALAILAIASYSTPAQDEARAAWQVTNFDISVSNPGSDRGLNVKAVLALRNIGRGPGSTASLRVNPKVEIKSIMIGSAVATNRAAPESRTGSQRITVNLPAQVAPNDSVSLTIEYRFPVADNTGVNSISPVGTQFLPQSMWYPVVNNSYSIRGADFAPFRLTISGGAGLSSGVEKSPGVFEQSLNAQPFFLIGTWDRIDGGAAKGISAYLPKGAAAEQQKQAEALIGLANDARTFFSGLLGPISDAPIRLIAVKRGAGFDDGGAVLLGDGSFARKKIDATTAMTIAEAVARMWIGGSTAARGEGNGAVREGLSRFLATLFIEKQFGPDAGESERARQRSAYAGIARRDGPVSRAAALNDPTYFSSVANKGAMVWRLADHLIGREVFMATLKELLAAAKSSPDGLSLTMLRAALAERGGATVKKVLDQQLDQTTDMDLLAGLPHQENGQWVAALRNLGTVEAVVTVAGYSSTGQRTTAQVILPAQDFGQAIFKNASQVTRVEVDPEKFYPQLDYTNDTSPRSTDVGAALAEANRLFGAQDYAKSENVARQLLASSPQSQEARIVLGRTLLAQNKIDEAEKEFKQLLAERLPLPAALAWGSIGLGEIAMRRNQSAEAVRLFTEAVRADAEYASTFTARSERIRAEGAGLPVDESVRNFVNQLDGAIRSGRQTEIAGFITPGELTRFVQQLVGSQPEAWQTKVVRTEQLDEHRVAADVTINSRQLGVDHAGTAVFIVTRAGGGYKLEAIEFFEVK